MKWFQIFSVLSIILLAACVKTTPKTNPLQGVSSLSLEGADSVSLGSVLLNTKGGQLGKLRNTGEVPLRIKSISIDQPFQVSVFNCTEELRPADVCEFEVSFLPTGEGTLVRVGKVIFEVDGEEFTQTFPVTAVAVAPGALTFLDAKGSSIITEVDFGTVFHSTSKTFDVVLFNSGTSDTRLLADKSLKPAAPFEVLAANNATFEPCTALEQNTLPPGKKCALRVRYSPLAGAVHSSTLQLAYENSQEEKAVRLNLLGRGRGPAVLQTVPVLELGFATVNVKTSAVLTLKNPGEAIATLDAAKIEGLNAPFAFKNGSFLAAGDCTTRIKPHANDVCSLTVEFFPTALGAFETTLKIPYNNGIPGTVRLLEVLVKGQAIAPVLSLSPAPVEFPDTFINATSSIEVEVKNNAPYPVKIVLEKSVQPTEPFRFAGGAFPGSGGSCSADIPLGAGSSCLLRLEFTPRAIPLIRKNLVLYYESPSREVKSDGRRGVVLQGQGITAATLQIAEEGAAVDFGETPVGGRLTRVVTLKNVGDVDATAVELANSLSLPFSFSGTGYPGLPQSEGGCGDTLHLPVGVRGEVFHGESSIGEQGAPYGYLP